MSVSPAAHQQPFQASAERPERRARSKAEEALERALAADRLLTRISRARTMAFIAAVAPLLLLETAPRDWWPALLLVAAAAAAAFATLVRRHRRTATSARRERLHQRIQQEALARMERAWDELPTPALEEPDEEHPFAADLDVLGHGSVAHLLGRGHTAPGRAVLRRVLLDPLRPLPPRARDLLSEHAEASPPATRPGTGWAERLAERQDAVRRLAREPDLVDELERAGREDRGATSIARAAAFLDWAGEAPWLADRRRLVWAARATAVFNVGTLAAWLAGWLSPPLWLPGLVVGYLLSRAVEPESERRFAAAEGGEHEPARWAAILEVARELPDDDPMLAAIREGSSTPEPGAGGAFAGLRRITDTAAVRRSGLTHLPLMLLFAWDVHLLDRLEAWQGRYGPEADRWVRAVGECELLATLAGLLHEHPSWSFPQFSGELGEGLSARNLGHPLLPPASCVGNDVEVPPPGRLLLVTGSNMAGKTTLLRALGTNQLLALMGAPVPAASLRTSPILPWTAMRVRDSVVAGVSYFMAELKRLRRVVDAARAGPVLFLLDEILQGTNTAERRTAARIVLRHLLHTRGVGAVTTHDLTLADAPDLRERSVDVHFREHVTEEDARRVLRFDYRLRPGPATSRNALLLLEMVGLGPSPDDPDAGPADGSDGVDGSSEKGRLSGS